jgi:hypothetical protein
MAVRDASALVTYKLPSRRSTCIRLPFPHLVILEVRSFQAVSECTQNPLVFRFA